MRTSQPRRRWFDFRVAQAGVLAALLLIPMGAGANYTTYHQGDPCQVTMGPTIACAFCPISGRIQCSSSGGCMTDFASGLCTCGPGFQPDAFGIGCVATCVPVTCPQLLSNCGQQSDRCGGTLDCGTCPAPQSCGGGGVAGQCGGCTPDCMGHACGMDPVCGTLNCGTCPAGQSCGGGGVAGTCGGGCVPKTCLQLGFNCGQQGDGCGGVLNCGPCNGTCTNGVCATMIATGTCLSFADCPCGSKCSCISGYCPSGQTGTCLAPVPDNVGDLCYRDCDCVVGGFQGSCGPPSYLCTIHCQTQADCPCATICNPTSGTCQIGSEGIGVSCFKDCDCAQGFCAPDGLCSVHGGLGAPCSDPAVVCDPGLTCLAQPIGDLRQTCRHVGGLGASCNLVTGICAKGLFCLDDFCVLTWWLFQPWIVQYDLAHVSQGGTDSATTSAVGPAPPSGYQTGSPSIYYDITTTVVYSGTPEVCINYAGVTFTGPPHLFHFENGTWVDRTTSVDTTNQNICGLVTSLSPFAVFGEACTTTPVVTLSAQPDCLWPPDHRMVRFGLGDGLSANVVDVCDPAPKVKIVGVVSNQPATGGGSGNTAVDVEFGTAGLCVRAERDGNRKSDRDYTVTVEATDKFGNHSTGTAVIRVPHDGAQVDCENVDSSRLVDDHDSRCTANLPPDPTSPPPHQHGDPSNDGGVRDPGDKGGGGCAIAGRPAPLGALPLGLLVAAVALRRRRTATPSAH